MSLPVVKGDIADAIAGSSETDSGAAKQKKRKVAARDGCGSHQV